jgi:aminomethyltransferase
VRESAAVLDRSHRSRFILAGSDADEVLRAVVAGWRGIAEGRAVRAAVLDDAGIIRDLVLVARTGSIAYLVGGEPGQRFETWERLRGAIREDYDARVDDRTETTCLLSLAGPGAADAAARHLGQAMGARLRPMECAGFEAHGFRGLAVRTGDTGEDGYEVMLAPAVAQHLVEEVRGAGVTVAGEVAHERARVEACVPAFDPDLAPGLTLEEADLGGLPGAGVGGGDRVRLSALLIETNDEPGTGTPVIAAGEQVGEVRSSVRSPAAGGTIALAILDVAHAQPGAAAEVAGRRASVIAKPFYRRRRNDGVPA